MPHVPSTSLTTKASPPLWKSPTAPHSPLCVQEMSRIREMFAGSPVAVPEGWIALLHPEAPVSKGTCEFPALAVA